MGARRNLQIFKQRMTIPEPDGKFPSIITGQETDAALRQMVLEFSNRCPLSQTHAHCPFCMLGGLSRPSLEHLVYGMKREAMVFLFDAECELRNEILARQAGGRTSKRPS
jgi:hypothetical protein